MCEHEGFSASIIVNRLLDIDKFIVEIQVHCDGCELPLEFIGLPMGLNTSGAAVSMDLREARLAAVIGIIRTP